jgi:transposase
VPSTGRHHFIPGIGKILALVLLYEIHDIDRFPRVQDFVSYCRLVGCYLDPPEIARRGSRRRVHTGAGAEPRAGGGRRGTRGGPEMSVHPGN